MKYNVYDGIDSDEFNYVQEMYLAEDFSDQCHTASYYETLETSEYSYDWDPSIEGDTSSVVDT